MHEKYMEMMIDELSKDAVLRKNLSVINVPVLQEQKKAERKEFVINQLRARTFKPKLEHLVDDFAKKYGTAVVKILKLLWHAGPDVTPRAQDYDDAKYVNLGFFIGRHLKSKDYDDVKLVMNNEIDEWFFEGCSYETGCSSDSYWPLKFRDKVLLPVLNYLRDSAQIVDFKLENSSKVLIIRPGMQP